MRVGIGYDIHAFDPARTLVLGGVKIEGVWGLRGHSDADVLLHAVADALLGAAALGDLGDHFPDTEEEWRDAPSAALLAEVRTKVRARGYVPVNVDVTVVAERPKLAPYRETIRERLASLLGLEVGAVSVKATTNEGLGPVGRGEGIAALAVVGLAEAEGELVVSLAGPRTAALLLGAAGLVLAACAGSGSNGSNSSGTSDVSAIATGVLTLQSGTISDLRGQRGSGPFRTYADVDSARMLEVVERAIREKARGAGGRPVGAIFVSPRYGEVIAKEREAAAAADDSYEPPFRSAVIVTVHPLAGAPGGCRIEIHATHRGPFHRGEIAWEADLPRWIDQALTDPQPAGLTGVKPIP